MIRTIEKLLIIFEIQLSENKTKFKANNKKVCHLKYNEYWQNMLTNLDTPRLYFSEKLKGSFGYEHYLDMENIHWRKSISKLRCSNHTL